MTTHIERPSQSKKNKFTFKLGRKSKLALGYFSLLIIPFLATYALDMQDKAAYAALISTVNTLAIMAFYIQFPLGSRLRNIPLFSNIDWNMSHHKKVGQWIGIIFFAGCEQCLV